VVPHGSLDPFDLQKKGLLKRFLGPLLIRPFLNGSAATVCSTQREADCLETYGAKCEVAVLPWAVERDKSHVERNDARKALAYAGDEFLVLFFGRIDYKKGFPVLLPAFKKLVECGVRAKLLIVGPDSRGYSIKVQQLVKRLGLSERVVFFPPKLGEEKVRIMKAADCFVLPSLNENFGNSVVEAMQEGLPVVISNNVYICDDVSRSKAGFVCKYDPTAVFEALRTLAENRNLRNEMAGAAARLGMEFTPSALREQYMALLYRVVGNQG
jgi:glycosyltransferase involved in cell wall biosynthesis